VHENMLP